MPNRLDATTKTLASSANWIPHHHGGAKGIICEMCLLHVRLLIILCYPTRLLPCVAKMGIFSTVGADSAGAPGAEEEHLQVLHAPAFEIKGRRRYVEPRRPA